MYNEHDFLIPRHKIIPDRLREKKTYPVTWFGCGGATHIACLGHE